MNFLTDSNMFWLLVNHIIPKDKQFTTDDLRKVYGVRYDLYEANQEYLLWRMAEFYEGLSKMLTHIQVGEAMIQEFWELNFAKYIYARTKDLNVIHGYWYQFKDEMIKSISLSEK